MDAAKAGALSMTGSELTALAYKACYALSFGAIQGLLDGARAAGGKAEGTKADDAPPQRLPTQNIATENEAVVVNRSLRDSRR